MGHDRNNFELNRILTIQVVLTRNFDFHFLRNQGTVVLSSPLR